MQNRIDPCAVTARLQQLSDLNGGPAAVARKCAIHVPTLECWLSGRTLPGCRSLATLSKGLNVSIDWIVFGEEATHVH